MVRAVLVRLQRATPMFRLPGPEARLDVLIEAVPLGQATMPGLICEQRGRRIEPDKADVIREVGQYEAGKCVLPEGFGKET